MAREYANTLQPLCRSASFSFCSLAVPILLTMAPPGSSTSASTASSAFASVEMFDAEMIDRSVAKVEKKLVKLGTPAAGGVSLQEQGSWHFNRRRAVLQVCRVLFLLIWCALLCLCWFFGRVVLEDVGLFFICLRRMRTWLGGY
jgi:hypothetical protein